MNFTIIIIGRILRMIRDSKKVRRFCYWLLALTISAYVFVNGISPLLAKLIDRL